MTKNILHCLDHGSAMGWLIDPTEQTIFVFWPKQQLAVFDESEQILPVPDCAQGLVLKVGTILG